jgi:hypothetical protein
MKDLREKAETGPSATRISEAEGETFRVENPALYPSDAVSPEGDYPVHGDWLSVIDDDGEQVGHLECPRGLAQELLRVVDNDDLGFPMDVTIDVVKLVDEEFQLEISASEAV